MRTRWRRGDIIRPQRPVSLDSSCLHLLGASGSLGLLSTWKNLALTPSRLPSTQTFIFVHCSSIISITVPGSLVRNINTSCPPEAGSSPTRGPGNKEHQAGGRHGKATPARANMAWAIDDDGTGAGTVCDGRRPFVEQHSVFFDPPNAVARKRKRRAIMGRVAFQGIIFTRLWGVEKSHISHVCSRKPARCFLNRAGSHFEKASPSRRRLLN